MAGIYLHIPFCKQACTYCNFHFSTSLKLKNDFLDALFQEINLAQNYLNHPTIETLYFGGGTPSVLSIDNIELILEHLLKTFNFNNIKEFTIEANPDDLSPSYLKQLKNIKNLPVNRLSVGTQSFDNKDLKWMNRAHNASEALNSIKNAQQAGFYNLNIDLIYGIPKKISESFEQNLATFLELKIPHLSAYCLTVEAKTPLAHQIKNNKTPNVNSSQAAEEMRYLINTLQQNNYEQYEVSNFATNKQYALHNTNYWLNKPYIGLGPSAHSYNCQGRRWNISNTQLYIKNIMQEEKYFTTETLSKNDKYNEYIMTGFRTKWGINLQYIEKHFGNFYKKHLLETLTKSNYKINEHYSQQNSALKLLPKGLLKADAFASNLFIV